MFQWLRLLSALVVIPRSVLSGLNVSLTTRLVLCKQLSERTNLRLGRAARGWKPAKVSTLWNILVKNNSNAHVPTYIETKFTDFLKYSYVKSLFY